MEKVKAFTRRHGAALAIGLMSIAASTPAWAVDGDPIDYSTALATPVKTEVLRMFTTALPVLAVIFAVALGVSAVMRLARRSAKA